MDWKRKLLMPYYILDDDHNPVPETDVLKWAQWFETFNRHVRSEMVGPYHVSTVFLGLDMNLFDGPPLLYETMVFRGIERVALDIQERCSTWDEAVAQHDRVAELMRKTIAG